jgi:hypothetical protein
MFQLGAFERLSEGPCQVEEVEMAQLLQLCMQKMFYPENVNCLPLHLQPVLVPCNSVQPASLAGKLDALQGMKAGFVCELC